LIPKIAHEFLLNSFVLLRLIAGLDRGCEESGNRVENENSFFERGEERFVSAENNCTFEFLLEGMFVGICNILILGVENKRTIWNYNNCWFLQTRS
jgi:hypothetical protein